MFDKNWNIIITLLVIVFVIAYFRNCYEGFGGTTTTTVSIDNAEAIRNVSSIYNKDEVKVTNVTATGTLTSNGALNAKGPLTVGEGAGKVTLSGAAGNKILIEIPNKAPFYVNDGINMGCWNNWSINNDGNARFKDIATYGAIGGPTIDWLNNRITALETRGGGWDGTIARLRKDLDDRTKFIIVQTGSPFPENYDRSTAGSNHVGNNGWWMWGMRR